MTSYSGRYIRWRLEAGGLEPYDPLGDLSVVGDDGAVEEQGTLIDAYLVALGEGLERLRHEPQVVMDVVVEPHALGLIREAAGVRVEYRNRSARMDDLDVFADDLKQAARRLVVALDEAADRAGVERPLMPGLRKVST